jgi:2-iminobutanoate/2-iminopropanoate deaminase
MIAIRMRRWSIHCGDCVRQNRTEMLAMKEYINPPELFPSLPYGFSQIVASQGGRTVYLSGQVAWDEKQRIVGAGDLRAQTWQTFKNLETAMHAAGGNLSDIVSLRIYIVEEQMEESRHISEALRSFFAAEETPATTWIGVRSLANKDFLIEIEAVAVIERHP